MSSYLVLNSWDGDNQEKVASRLAQMFRMEIDQAFKILDELVQGGVWRIEKMISDKQADMAEKYLRGLGFGVERTSADDVEITSSSQAASSAMMEDSRSKESGKAQSAAASQAVARQGQKPSGPTQEVEFHGQGVDLAKIMIVNWIFTVFSFGVYYFWGKTKTRRYLFEQSSFAGDRFSYHGTGGELFKGAIIFFLLIGALAGGVAVAQSFFGPAVAETINTVLSLSFIVIFPALMVGAYRYRLSRSAWRNIRFSFRGTRQEAIWKFVSNYILVMLTLGLYTPYFQMKLREFWVRNSYFGSKKFEFDGEGKDIFKNFLLAIPLSLLTLGLYSIWYKAFVARYTWSHTHFAGGTFRFTATGGEFFKLYITNLLLLVLTLGIAFPWVIIRSQKFTADHLSLEGNVNLNRVVQEIQKSGAVGEGAVDAFDIPLDIV